MREEVEGLAPQPESLLIEQTNLRWLDRSEDWEQQPKIHDRPWATEEMIRDPSLRSE